MPIIAALFFATLVAVVGAVVGVRLGQMGRSKLEMLVHVATGALLGITAFDILPEAKAVLTWPLFVASTLFGYALLWVVGKFVFYVCPSCAIAHMEGDAAMARRGSLILLATALGIHCVLDGVAISTGRLLSERAEIGALLGVGLHKLPEGLALGLLLVGARYSKKAAVAISGGIESLTIVGGLVGLLLAQRPTPEAIGIVFALVGGGFVYLVYNALGGALTHKMHVPRARGLSAEAISFVGTGVLLWLAGKF
jgi:ZIP family zinc transporter